MGYAPAKLNKAASGGFLSCGTNHCVPSDQGDHFKWVLGVLDAEEMNMRAPWKVADPLFSALNRHLPVGLAAKMADCSGASSYVLCCGACSRCRTSS